MEDGSGSGGHALSLPAADAMSLSDEDVENQLPFDHADSDGYDDDDLGRSDSDDSDAPEMQEEASMMEEVRALIEYAMPSELGANAYALGLLSPAHQDQIREEHHRAYLAKAALLLPVAMDLYTIDRDPEVVKSRCSLRRVLLISLSLLIFLTCGGMHLVFEFYSSAMSEDVMNTASDSVSLQSSTFHGMLDNVASDHLKHVLGGVSQTLSDSILRPADHAVESLSGYMRSLNVLNSSWDGSLQALQDQHQDEILYRIFMELDGQWKIQEEGPFGLDHVVASEKTSINQLRSLSVISSGKEIGMAGSSFAVSCPSAGPATCGRCLGECTALFMNSFTTRGSELIRHEVNLSSGLPAGGPLLAETSSHGFELEQQASGSPVQKRWSKITRTAQEAPRFWRTAPFPCGHGGPSCGVIAAEIVLDHVSDLCQQALSRVEGLNANASIFVVQSASPDPDQLGLPVGAAYSDEALVAATSRALAAKFTWTSEALRTPQLLSFRKSLALKGEFVACGSHLIMESADRDDCFQAATIPLSLDPFTTWLLVAVVGEPHVPLTENALAALEELNSGMETNMTEARVTAGVIVVFLGFLALLVGSLLSWTVTTPMQQLSCEFSQAKRFDWLLPQTDECEMSQSFAIKDVADAHKAFRKFITGIRAFSHFIPEEVVFRIIEGNPRAVRPHVDSRTVTIMFTGIRDIIRVGLNEEQLLSVITRFHRTMTSIVEQYGGTVGEILDEGLLVYFNAPNRLADHALKACEAGLAQQKAMGQLRRELIEDGWLDSSDTTVTLGVGIHTGVVLVGCIGSTVKMKFGCIGDAVNLASRLKGICKFYGVDVMCSEETYLATRNSLCCRKIDDLQVKGRVETTAVYEVMASQHQKEVREGGILTPENVSAQSAKPAPQTIGARSALMLPIEGGRKKGPPQFLPPEQDGAPPMLLTQLSRSPRSFPNSPVVLGRQVTSPGRTPGTTPGRTPGRTTPGERTTAGDRTRTNGGATWSTSHASCPTSSPGSASEGFSRHGGRGSSSSMSPPAALEEVTMEQRLLKEETEAALEAYQQSRPKECVKICRKVLEQKPDDTVTRRLLEKALQHPGFPAVTVMAEK